MVLPRIEERTLYPPLISCLKSIGFDAIGETKVTTVHPDILFKVDSLSFVIEVKIGKPEVGLKAVAQASDYARKMGTQNIVILIYPEKYRNQVVFDSNIVEKIALHEEIDVLVLTEYWTKSLNAKPPAVFQELKTAILSKTINVDFSTIVNLIESYVKDLNSIIYQVKTEELASEVVNKLDLFSSIGEIKDKAVAKKQVMNLASYLLFNQLLFYHIFKRTTDSDIPELDEIEKLRNLQEYFDEVTNIDYKSIYNVNILGHVPENATVIDTLNEVIKAIKLLRAEHITHDLAGRFFHDLIPFEVRKVLAAFYTHPVAAEILAGLCIDRWDERVMDPACGSGTLLVSSYIRKMRLYKELHGFKNVDWVHEKFIENDIAGIDIMPFAAHITTLNLATQDIEQKTNYVQIATQDSLALAPALKTTAFLKNEGIRISSYTREIQDTLVNVGGGKVVKKTGAVSANGKSEGFFLRPADVIIMNPPFSDREKMPEEMRDKLRENDTLTKVCGNQVNLWGFFIALADLAIKPNGKIGTVIPINIARGKATDEVRDYLLRNYSLKYVVKATEDLAFSEGASFRDVLLVAEKCKPHKEDFVGIVFLKKSIRQMSLEEATKVAENIRAVPRTKRIFRSDDFDIFFEPVDELFELRDNLMPVLGASEVNSIIAFSNFLKILREKSKSKLVELGKLLDMEKTVKEGFHSSPAGLSQLTFVTNPFGDDRIERAFLILNSEKDDSIEIKVKNANIAFKVPKAKTLPALRTLTNVNRFHIGKERDYFVTGNFKGFDTLLTLSKWASKEDFDWELVREEISEKNTYLATARRFRPNSDNTHFFAFFSNIKFIVPDTFKIFKISKEEAKLQSLYLNSVIGLLNIVSLREQTTEGYTDIRGSELDYFITVDSKHLSEREVAKLNELFTELHEVEFPSIIEQLESRFWGRVKLDESILKILGLSEEEIGKWLPKVYDALAKELIAI
jgi:hypothetical protein